MDLVLTLMTNHSLCSEFAKIDQLPVFMKIYSGFVKPLFKFAYKQTHFVVFSGWFSLQEYQELIQDVWLQKAEIKTLRSDLQSAKETSNETSREISILQAELEKQSLEVVRIHITWAQTSTQRK